MHFEYFMPTRLIFGRGKLNELAVRPLPGKKALIVITNGRSMRSLGYLSRVEDCLKKQGAGSVVFDKVLPNPIEEHIMEAAELARNENCDFVIGLGGGSAIDSAKSIAVMARNPGTYWEYVKGKKQLSEKVLPVIAIPTTAGTGTEANPWTVITNNKTNEKIGFGIPEIFPLFSIIDPELMVSVPTRLTAYQGMDAFFHSVEGYLSNKTQPVSDLYALDSIRLINEYLPQAVADGSNLQAREKMAWACTQAGIVESISGCISEHSMEHALSAFYPELPHGAGLVALSVPYYSYLLRKGRNKVRERYIEMAHTMGKRGEEPEQFITALKELIEKVGLSNLRLSEWGIKKDEAENLAANSFEVMGVLYSQDPISLSKQDAACVIRDAIY